jgi:hypothetical protein
MAYDVSLDLQRAPIFWSTGTIRGHDICTTKVSSVLSVGRGSELRHIVQGSSPPSTRLLSIKPILVPTYRCDASMTLKALIGDEQHNIQSTLVEF